MFSHWKGGFQRGDYKLEFFAFPWVDRGIRAVVVDDVGVVGAMFNSNHHGEGEVS